MLTCGMNDSDSEVLRFSMGSTRDSYMAIGHCGLEPGYRYGLEMGQKWAMVISMNLIQELNTSTGTKRNLLYLSYIWL